MKTIHPYPQGRWTPSMPAGRCQGNSDFPQAWLSRNAGFSTLTTLTTRREPPDNDPEEPVFRQADFLDELEASFVQFKAEAGGWLNRSS